MSYYESALSIWREQADSDGAAVMAACPGIALFHRKGRDHVRVEDAVACLQGKAAAALDEVSEMLWRRVE